MVAGPRVSHIAAAEKEIGSYIDSVRGDISNRIEAVLNKRQALRKEATQAGLRTVAWEDAQAVDDLTEKDDAGRLIECNFKIRVKSSEELARAVQFCKDKNLLALPIGAKTSALGVFESFSTADKKGFSGVMGIQMEAISAGDKGKDFGSDTIARDEAELSADAQLLSVPDFDPNEYELVRDKKYPIAVLKSKSFPEDPKKPHRVLAHAGMRVVDINGFLETHLGSDERYRYKIMADPTSKYEAQLGGVVSTGAEGGNRAKAKNDVRSLRIVDGNAEERNLDREQSQAVVGLNGNAGFVTQVEFEVTAFPRHEHALWIPVNGKGKEAWQNLLRLQDALRGHCRSENGEDRIQVGKGAGGIIVTGMEPLSSDALSIAKGHVKGSDSLPSLPEGEMGLYLTFSSFYTLEDFEALFAEDFIKNLGLGMDADDEGYFLSENETHRRVLFLGEQQEKMDEVRHGAPAASREKAKQLGDITQSTDLNIRVESEDPEERQRAMDILAGLFDEYATAFPAESGFQVPIYGHVHPGNGEGGGIDPHIRVIFELSNPGSRFDAPEQVLRMKKMQRNLYRKLLALEGQHGITIHAPEKSRFTTPEYWEWLCLTNPEEARSYLMAIKEFGYSKDGEGQPDRPTIGARVPHELPGLLDRLPGGLRALFNDDLVGSLPPGATPEELHPVLREYWPAIVELSQLSHRGGTIKKLFGEVCRSLHEKLHLSENQYPFFIESPLEAESIVERNFGPDHPYKIQHLAVHLEDLASLSLEDQENTFYVLDLTGFGLPKGLSLMVTPHAAVKEAYEGTVAGTNRAAFRNLYSMWSKWPYETDETPNIPAVASLGLVLQAEDLPEQKRVQREYPVVTTNPGPGQIHPAIKGGVEDLFDRYGEATSPEGQRRVIMMLKDYLGLPAEHQVAFFTSATQIMQVMALALKDKEHLVNIQQVTNDSFSDRLNEILVAELGGDRVTRHVTPWTTGEHSQLEEVSTALVAGMVPNKRNLIFVTPHKTSTTADFHPDVLIAALKAKGKIHGKDYELICDVTSGVGARDYATVERPDDGSTRIGYAGQFGSFQKGMGQAPGLAALSLSPQLAALLVGTDLPQKSSFGLSETLHASAAGETINPMGLAMLRQKLEADRLAQRTPKAIQEETERKLTLVMGWLERHPDLLPLVPDSLDRSPLLVGIFSQAKNLTVAKRILAEIGYIAGGGYGPFDKESLRLYLPTITEEELKALLAALDLVLETPDVVGTRGENIPNVALREPHDPLSVIERLGNKLTVDDIFRDSVGLHWLDRLAKTYNATQKETDRVDLGGPVPEGSVGFQAKSGIYAHPDNLAGMRGIFDMVDEDSRLPMGHYYGLYLDAENHIRGLMKRNPEAEWGNPEDEAVTAQVTYHLARGEDALKHVARLLRKYVAGNGHFPPAPRDAKNRVAWPLAA